MKSSGSSSATGTTPSTAPRPRIPPPEPTDERKSFALTGPSVRLDPLTHAVRRDLADVRLADRVFAPHYAAPALRTLARPTALKPGRDTGEDELARLAAGEPFEVLEIAGGQAWGVAPARGLVGYLDADALAPA